VHLVCRGCGTITEADPDVVDSFTETFRERHGFTTDVGHLTVFGRCASCADDREGSGR
jgi:Fur family ferric uptake transcriptional regulator